MPGIVQCAYVTLKRLFEQPEKIREKKNKIYDNIFKKRSIVFEKNIHYL